MSMTVAYPPMIFSEILDFLVTSPSLQEIIDFKPSQDLEEQLSYLLAQNKRDALSEEERLDLDAFLQLNHFVNMLKIRARKKLAE
jgi:hypothetical protein